MWKQARFEALSCVGILGAALILLANVQGWFKFADWVRPLSQRWIDITTSTWRQILLVLHLEPLDAQLLNALAFILLMLLFSLRRAVGEVRWTTRGSALSSVLLTAILFHAVLSRAEAITPKIEGALLPTPKGFLHDWIARLFQLYSFPADVWNVIRAYLQVDSLKDAWFAWSLFDITFARVLGGILLYGLIILWAVRGMRAGIKRLGRMGLALASLMLTSIVYIASGFEHPELVGNAVFTDAIIGIGLFLLGVPLIAATDLFSEWSPCQFDLTILNRRLWQILGAIGSVLLVHHTWHLFAKGLP